MHTRCPNAGCAFDMESAEAQQNNEVPVEVEGRWRCPRCNTWMGNIFVQKLPPEPERYKPEPEPEPVIELNEEAIDEAVAEEAGQVELGEDESTVH